VDVGVAVVTHEEEREAAATPEAGLERSRDDGDVLHAPGRQHVDPLVTPRRPPTVAPLERAVERADEPEWHRRAVPTLGLGPAGPLGGPGGGFGLALGRLRLALSSLQLALLALLITLRGHEGREAPGGFLPLAVQLP